MAKSTESLVSFSAGEWSPTLTGRVDQNKYRAACIQMRNMLSLKTGPATRRPGTQFIAAAKTITGGSNFAVRMEDFQFSISTAFMLEFGHQYLRFLSNGAQVTLSTAATWVTGTAYVLGNFVEDPGDSNAIYYCQAAVTSATQPHADATHWRKQSIYELPTPYDATVGAGGLAATEVYQLQCCPINDVTYIVHPKHPRQKLVRYADTNWVIGPVLDLTPALLDQNATDTTIASSAATGTTTLTASAPAWATANYYDVGSSVLQSAVIYECNQPHVAGTFAADLAAGYWSAVTIFQAAHVGAYWELAYLRDSAYVEYTGVAATGFAAGVSGTITALGDWEVHTYGVWSADLMVQASNDGGVTWQTVRTVAGRCDRNVDIKGTAVRAQLYRVVVTNVAVPGTPGVTNPRVVFECVDAFLFGLVQITGYTNAYTATAKVITQLTVADAWISGQSYAVNDRVGYLGINYVCIVAVSGTTDPATDTTSWLADGYPTMYWSEGAWSGVRGYPAAITAYEQRIWCGFTDYEPQRIWGTQVGDIENWSLGDQTLSTDGVAFDLDAVRDGAILWMQAQEALFVGMVSGEWVVQPADGTTGIGPANITARRQSKWGSNANVPARIVGDALVFFQRQAFSLRQMLFSVVTNKYMSQDLTALSEQIMNGGGLTMAYQKQGSKNGFLWVTTANGEMVAMTYELDQEIFGWHRHHTGLNAVAALSDPGFESVATIQGQGTADDEVWVVVRRLVGGVLVRYIERLNPINWQTVVSQPGQTPGYGANKNQAFHVDSGKTYVNPQSNVFTGLDHLEGRDVVVCVNAQSYGTFTVASGQITVDGFTPTAVTDPITYAHIGLPYESILQPMNLDVDVHTGVTHGITKKVTGLYISFLNTLACTVTDGSSTSKELIFRNMKRGLFSWLWSLLTQAPNLGGEVPLYSGVYDVKDFPGQYGLIVPVIMKTRDPLPMTVLGVAIQYENSGTP